MIDEGINVLPNIVIKAEVGDAGAQLELGKVYFNAILVEKNLDTAFKWTFLSAEQGNMEAQYMLGNLYCLGFGVVKSFSDAYGWYTKAAIQGYKKALVRIHNMYQEDIRMHCRGQINSKEKEWASEKYKKENNIRELYEYRLEQNKSILNGAIEYFISQFKHYQIQNQADPIIQLNLAFLYQHGYGVKKCSRWAFEYYELAANQGNVDAQYNLGYLYQKHTIKKFNYRHAFKWYTEAAQGGNIAAQRSLAYFYLKGLAIDIDYDAAIFWYTTAANAGDSEAQVTLGKLYRKGDYINQNLSTAVKWYSLAARQGSRVAQNCLTKLYQRGMLTDIELEADISEYLLDSSINERLCSKLSMNISKLNESFNFKQSTELAKRACIGDGPAMYEIGVKYYKGEQGFDQDKDTGIIWIKKAANARHKEAQFMLADLYRKGDPIKQNYHKACIWYRKITHEKDPQARCNLGIMYNEGLGVRKDPLEASKWFIWAADQENSDAQYNLGMLRYEGRGIRKDDAEAVEWLYKSVHQKNIQACYQLGYFYSYGGAGLRKNVKNADILSEFAAKNGQIDAQIHMGNRYKDGLYVKKNIPKSIVYYTMAADSGSPEALYEMAIKYLNGDDINCDYMKAYERFKHAKNKGFERANGLFRSNIQHDLYIKDYFKVLEMFIKVTEKGIDDFSYHIGCLYWYGIKGEYGQQVFQQNYTKAEEWFLIASENGDSRAYYRLGIMYECGKGVERNLVTAIQYYSRAIQNKNDDAMYRLACIFLNKYSTDQDLLQAFQLFTKASTMGHQKAAKALMVFQKYEATSFDPDHSEVEDTGIPVNEDNLICMLEKATERGYTRLQYQLGVMYEHNNEYPRAFKWFSLSASFRITDAYYRVGLFYEEGRGAKQNYSMAANKYKKAAGKGHEDACYRLGRLYHYGNGVKIDYLKAYDFYKKAAKMGHGMASKSLDITLETKDSLIMCKHVAENGNTEVQFKVGFAYEYSFPESNYVEAHKWYSMAANNSHREAMYHLGLLYEQGLGVSQNYHEAIQLYDQASQLGSDDALFRLAIMYHHGKGVNIDQKKAMEYYTLSAEFGNPKYQCELGRLCEEGEIVQRNPLETLKWYTKAYTQGYDDIRPKLCATYEDKKPYEKFFYQRLFRNLSIATCNHFRLNEIYRYADYGSINRRLGTLYFFGLGTEKDLKQVFHSFSMKYSDISDRLINNFSFLRYGGFSASQRYDILKGVEADQELIDQLEAEQLYALGMVYYDGVVQTQYISKNNEKKGYTPIDDQDPNDPSQYVVIKKDHLKAFKYMKKAAGKKYFKAMIEPVLFHYTRDAEKDSTQGIQCHAATSNDNTNVLDSTATFHTVQDFSKAVEWYICLEEALFENRNMEYWDRMIIKQQIHIGWGYLYEYGYGTEQNYKKAIKHYKMLSDSRNLMGKFRLGLMYYYGKGVSVDYKKALEQFKNVENRWGDVMVFIYDHNDLYTSDFQKKIMYCTKTKDEVKGESSYYLGLMHKYGKGIPKDDGKARFYFREAFERGCERAKNEIN